MKSALGYMEETLLNAEIVKLVPKCLAPVVGGILSRCLNSHKTIFRSLIPATEERIAEKELKDRGHKVPERVCRGIWKLTVPLILLPTQRLFISSC